MIQQIPCPKCGAKKGESCGHRKDKLRSHFKRLQAAQKYYNKGNTMTPIERMKEDAKICNSKLKTNSKVIYTPEPTESRGRVSRTSGDGWRNEKLSNKEIADIKYFLGIGWDMKSTAVVCGVSYSSVQRISKS